LAAVMLDGKMIQTGGRARMPSAGCYLTRLKTGSDDTFGIIADLKLRLFGSAESFQTAICNFKQAIDPDNVMNPDKIFGL
jgi:D-lactate dehydrogenase (cytochrome)